MSGKRRKFTKEFKGEIVNLVRNGGRSVPDVAREHELVETCVYSWVKQARIDGGDGSASALKSQDKEELTRLRKKSSGASDWIRSDFAGTEGSVSRDASSIGGHCRRAT
jgi:transposase